MGDSLDATRHAALNMGLDLSRRDVLKIAGYSSLAAFIAACGGATSSGPTAGVTATGGTLSIGSYSSDPAPKAGLQALVNDFMAANGGTKVTINTVDHGTFQNQINSYLQGTPEDVFTWFSGHRMRFFADKGLAAPIDDVWGDDLLLPVGALLPQGRLRGRQLHDPDELGCAENAVRADEEGWSHPDRL